MTIFLIFFEFHHSLERFAALEDVSRFEVREIGEPGLTDRNSRNQITFFVTEYLNHQNRVMPGKKTDNGPPKSIEAFFENSCLRSPHCEQFSTDAYSVERSTFSTLFSASGSSEFNAASES